MPNPTGRPGRATRRRAAATALGRTEAETEHAATRLANGVAAVARGPVARAAGGTGTGWAEAGEVRADVNRAYRTTSLALRGRRDRS